VVGPLTAASRADKSAPKGSTRVLIVGNSFATLLAPAFGADPSLAVLDESVGGCGFPPGLTDVHLKLPNGAVVPQPACDPTWERGVIERFHPKIVFWIVSDPIGTGGKYQGRVVRPCSATYDALYRQQLAREVATLGAGGAREQVPRSSPGG
jgi:hypothetical protein